MLCQNCGKKEAVTYFKQTVNGQTREAHLCADCAAKLGGGFTAPIQSMFSNDPFFTQPFGSWFSSPFVSSEPFTHAIGEGRRCPTCGMTEAELRRTGRAGCAACYDTFEDILTPYIKKLQGATAHVGTAHAPAGQPEQAKPDPVADLKAKLQEAISREKYEEAARLRDEIRRLEGQK